RRTRTLTGLLSARYSCPLWLAELWCSAYGEKRARELLRAGLSAPPVGLRFNWSRQEARGLYRHAAASAPLSGGAHGVGFYGPVPGELGRALEQGLVSRQSLAVQEAMQAFRPGSWSPPVWDACAGRGGKSCLLGEQGLDPIWASDSNLPRLKGLTGEQDRLGLPGILVFAARADASPCLKSQPRTILVDAPCSGLGVLSRRPDIKWKRREADIARLAGLQSKILDQAWLLLPPGGRLVYLTCTLSPQENEQQLARLLGMHGRDRLEREWHTPFDAPLGEFLYGFSLLKG
ncbi:MAG: RsmB/NOP family class I SAM-dependent RNA methyltransferase, partial [Desulfovibrionales bacterium]